MFSKSLGFTAPQYISLSLYSAGIDFVFLGKSLICPTLDLTIYSDPSIFDIAVSYTHLTLPTNREV